MAGDDAFTADESRQLAIVFARAWADPALADAYGRDPKAVLSGAGINLRGREAPEIPPKPDELAAQPMAAMAAGSSASSLSCATCPCTECTASCACCTSLKVEQLADPQLDAMMKLAEDPDGRAEARRLMASWDVKVGTTGS